MERNLKHVKGKKRKIGRRKNGKYWEKVGKNIGNYKVKKLK